MPEEVGTTSSALMPISTRAVGPSPDRPMPSTRSALVALDPAAAHVAPINELVGRLRRGGVFVPYLHHSHGGVHAPVLSVSFATQPPASCRRRLNTGP